MTTAKPQQGTGQADTSSDDLIAELARLMASDAKAEKPPVAAVTSASAPSAEVRIPSGSFRIPGMDEPVQPSRPALDFGQPVAPPPVPQATPMPSQDRPAALPPEPAVDDRPRVSSPMPAFAHLATPTPAASKPAATFAPSQSLNTQPRAPQPASPIVEPFKFDFGVINPAPVAPAAPAPAPIPMPDVPPRPQAAAPQAPVFAGSSGQESAKEQPRAPEQVAAAEPEHDPIADLIAAELDAHPQPDPAQSDAPQSFVLKPAPVTPVVRPVATPVAARATPISPSPIAPARPAPGVINTATPARVAPAAPQPAATRSEPAFNDFGSSDFGLGPKTADKPVAASAPMDPIDEIESLIGEAVRVELSAPPRSEPAPSIRLDAARPAPSPAVSQQSPVVPPLNAQFAPRRSSLKDRPSDAEVHAAAEEAILAAAAVTGAEVGRIRNVEQDSRAKPERAAKASRAPTNLKPLIGIAVAGTLLLAAGFGLYWVLGLGRGDGTAPVLTADATPVKQAPEVTEPVAEAPRSVVMDEIDGVAPAEGEQLVSRDQSTDEAVVAAEPVESDGTEAGLTNRKVRTVTVRPDGTIVSGDDAVAGAAQLPVERPNVPEMPAAGLDGSDLLTGVPAPDAAADPIGALAAQVDPATPVTAEVPATAPANIDPTLVAPVPAPRIINREALAAALPTVQPTSAVNAVVADPAATGLATTTGGQQIDLLGNPAPVEQPQQAAAPLVNAPAYVQLSSQRSEGEAQAAGAEMVRRFGGLFNGQQPIIRRVDLGSKGIFFRVWLPSNSMQEASQICGSIKANGGDCFPVNG